MVSVSGLIGDLLSIQTDVEEVKDLPAAIVTQDLSAIVNYYKQIKIQDYAPLFEAKLLIVGEPGAGKYSRRQATYAAEGGSGRVCG